MKSVVIFDLDGTLVKGQSQRLLLEYLFRKGIIGVRPCSRLYLWFILHRLGLANNPEKIMRYAFSLFSNWRADIIEVLVKDFYHERLRSAIFSEARDLVASHDPESCDILLVSNAFDAIVDRAAQHLGIRTAIGTRMERKGDRFTGRLDGDPVFGVNKSRIVREHVQRHNLSFMDSYAYGDSISDLPVLEMVANPVAVNPDRELTRIARQRGWRILRFNGTRRSQSVPACTDGLTG